MQCTINTHAFFTMQYNLLLLKNYWPENLRFYSSYFFKCRIFFLRFMLLIFLGGGGMELHAMQVFHFIFVYEYHDVISWNEAWLWSLFYWFFWDFHMTSCMCMHLFCWTLVLVILFAEPLICFNLKWYGDV